MLAESLLQIGDAGDVYNCELIMLKNNTFVGTIVSTYRFRNG